jgi:two-component system, chemotaxis family, protein-glutamate methylesterase/glutaminase
MIRVLVVDDSAVMRRIIARMLGKDPAIEVVGTAENGEEAIEKVALLKPDVVTMDVEMPRMDGLEALRIIMTRNPLPVIMLSALTREGADTTLDALNMGASDFVPKDFTSGTHNLTKIEEELLRKVRAVSKKHIRPFSPRPEEQRKPLAFRPGTKTFRSMLVMGASTGGPVALQHILTSLPADFPVPIAIAQHMPKAFTQTFAERLNGLTQIVVKEAEQGEPVRSGTALVAPGDTHMNLRRKGAGVVVELVDDPSYVYRPSVDFLFSGVARIFESKVVAVVLTGMGTDGLAGVREVRARNGYVIAQDEETSAVFGMPKAIIEGQLANIVAPVHKIAEEIMRVL